MASVDDRVVQMTLNSGTFLGNAAKILQSITQLKNGLNNFKGGKAFDDLNASSKKVDLNPISSGLEKLSSKFSAMRVAGVAAFAGLVTSAALAGARLIKSFTLDPIKAGLDVYETKINAIKTILANTQAEGTNLKQVTAALNELNTYANKTVYNFGEMAKNIGTFTAAGVDLKTSIASIKGIANLAALSGSTSEQASTAMYQLSQAIAAGTVKLQDWNSVVNAGMGGKVFQTALENTARAMGVHIDEIIKKAGSFRNSLQEGWLSSKILTRTLEQFTGDLSVQQLKAMGFTEKESLAIQKQGKLALSSATDIRTVSQLFQALKEEVATAWSHVFEALIGNIGQATSTLSKLHTVLENMFTGPINSLSKFLEKWVELGGRATLIQGLVNVFHALGAILHTIGSAFKEVFPPATANAAIAITQAFERFSEAIQPSAETLARLRSIFVGLFSAVKIVIDVIKGVAIAIGTMFGAAKGAGGGILDLGAKLGDFISKIKTAIESGTGFTKFFTTLGKILAVPVKILGVIISILGHLGEAFGIAVQKMQPFFAFIVQGFTKLGDAIANAVQSGDISKVLAILNQGIFAAILLAIKKFIGGLGGKLNLGGASFIDQIKGVFTALSDSLSTLQRAVNSQTLRNIAIAVGILAASLIGLSLVDPKSLAKGIAAMTGLFTQLIAAMAVVAKISPVGIAQLFAVTASLNLMASAIAILAGAVAILAQFSWEQLAKGIATIAASMAIFVGTISLLSKSTGEVIAAAFSMDLIAASLILLATAIKILSTMDWAGLTKGIVTITLLLAIMAGFNRISGPAMIATGAGLLIVGSALNVIALAIKQLGSLSIAELAKGLVAVAASLLIIATAMSLMPPTMIATGAGLLVVAAALNVLAGAMRIMGGMSWSAIAKSLVELAGSLVILAAGMALMTGTLAGAAALVVVSAALAILTPTLISLGSIGWGTLLSALGALAVALAVLGAAGILLAPVAPAIAALGAALVVFGAGMLAIGGGIALLGIGLTAIGVAVTTSGAGIVKFVKDVLSLIPFALTKIAQGIAAFAGGIAKSGGAIIKAFASILTDLSNAIVKSLPAANRAFIAILTTILNDIQRYSPRIAKTFTNLLLLLLSTIANNIGKFVQKGADILVGFLRGIANNIGRVAREGTNVVIAFINAVGNNAGRVVNAGISMVIRFVNGVANSIRSHTGELRSAGLNLAEAIIDGMTGGLLSLAGRAISAAASLGQRVLSALGKAIKFFSPSHIARDMGKSIPQGFALGIRDDTDKAQKAGVDLGTTMLGALQESLDKLDGDTGVLQPTITPVLDLVKVKKGFKDMSSMAIASLTPKTSASLAGIVSTTSFKTLPELERAAANSTILTFNQTNTSPRALSTADIYRQTKNQLSVVRKGLPG